MEIVEEASGGAGAEAATGSSEEDLALLRAHEPVLRYTSGELFFPTAVGPYVEPSASGAAGRRGRRSGRRSRRLDLERLCGRRFATAAVRSTSASSSSRSAGASTAAGGSSPGSGSTSGARFTTTGMFGRLVDAGIRASLLLRGKVAGGLAAAAEITYRERLERDRFTYYGRVFREGGYVCLQYWFFYAMNDWRSTFGGVNDHEADWETSPSTWPSATTARGRPGSPSPRTTYRATTCAAAGTTPTAARGRAPGGLRRRRLALAAPSSPGDYVISVDPPPLRAADPVLQPRCSGCWLPWRDDAAAHGSGFGIPFVDYARGDGVAIGPGRSATGRPC